MAWLTDKKTAARRLTARWHEQCERFPAMRAKVPLKLYIERNWRDVAKNDLLKDYVRA